jgi:hypothetical protein
MCNTSRDPLSGFVHVSQLGNHPITILSFRGVKLSRAPVILNRDVTWNFYTTCTCRGADNHSPNVSGIQAWRVNIATHLSAWRVLFSPLTDSSSPDPELFSDLASQNS